MVRDFLYLVAVAAILFAVAGCGPGEPFEIEGRYGLQAAASTHVAAR